MIGQVTLSVKLTVRSRREAFLLYQVLRIHGRRLGRAPVASLALMFAVLIIRHKPSVEISLELLDGRVDLLPMRDLVELLEKCPMEVRTNAVRVGALSLGRRVIEIVEREVQLVLV